MPFTEVYVDMDGVVADWHLQAARTIRQIDPHMPDPIEMAEAYDKGEALCRFTSHAAFWPRVTDPSWWLTIPDCSERLPCLPVLDLFECIRQELQPSSVTVLTALPEPRRNHPAGALAAAAAASGKLSWLKARMGLKFHDVALVAKTLKPRFAHPQALILDDNLGTCQAFIERGGAAIEYYAPRATPTALVAALHAAKPGHITRFL